MQCTGKVTSLAQSTGAEFAELPPQNATGNWVKVVQRIPVRTSVICKAGDPPLRVGMGVTIAIDTGHRRSFRGLLRSLGLRSSSGHHRLMHPDSLRRPRLLT